MSRTDGIPSLVLTQFREFYGELIRLKQRIRSGTFVTEHGSADAAGVAAAVAVAERLAAILERQAAIAGRRGTDYTGIYRQAEYVMASLADEILLHQLDWIGKTAWSNHLMEYRLFQTRVAGDEFFKRLDRLLLTPDPMYKDLATVYLFAIMLGFRGKYWAGNDGGTVDAYRRQLFTFIFHGQPELQKETMRLFPDAYLHTVEEGAGRKVPQVKWWFVLLAALIVAYVLVARWIWLDLSTPVEQIISRIEEMVR